MRAVIAYAYHQRGLTTHWDRGKSQFRNAVPDEHSTPLGARLAENDQKTVWIKLHVEVEPAEDPEDVIDHHEREADVEFLTHRPGHIILATST
jgi:hypothetical protein